MILKNKQNKSGKSDICFPILVRKNGKEQSRSRMNLYIYRRDLGKKREKKAIFQACFFEEKSIYAPKKSDRELLGHTLHPVLGEIVFFSCTSGFMPNP